MSQLKVVTNEELAKHNKPGDLWLAVNGDVYDVSKFAPLHPGGAKVLEHLGGHDVTTEFFELHRKSVLDKDRYRKLVVGRLAGAGERKVSYGVSDIPFAEIPGLQGQHSPFYNDSHKNLLAAVRAFVEVELMPIAADADMNGTYPDAELKKKQCTSGVMLSRMGRGPWLEHAKEMGLTFPGGVTFEEYDYFHEMIAHQEISRIGLPGFIDSLGTGYLISCPAVFNFASDEIKRTVGRELLAGDKWSALSLSEPFAGSDVAGMRATAIPSADGEHFVVNGVKKWITEGMYADYFVTAARTGDAGAKGISMMLVNREHGLETKQLKTTYSVAAGTALVIYDDAKVPKSNLFGKLGDGFKMIMYNFNHERWMIANNLIGQVRAALTDAFLWARQRKIFGKQLIDQPVIRAKLAASAAALESVQAFNEAITYDMSKSSPLGTRLAGPIAMLKLQTTRMAWDVVDNTVQILGGRGITRTGMGAKVEGLKNFAKYAAVYGGSEEIMADLAIKQALSKFPTEAKL